MRAVRGILMLGLSAAAGLAAVAMVDQPKATVVDKDVPMVVIAKEDLVMGSVLDAKMLKAVPWPGEVVPVGTYTDPLALTGRVVTASLVRGEPVLDPKLAPEGSKGGLSSMISEGNRAITVKVNEVVGVAGFALPGNFVDVLVSTEDNSKNAISKIVLERILVLAIAQKARGTGDNAPQVVDAVTLEVSPQQAERLDLARSVGALSLVLRNQIDEVQALTQGVRKGDLFAKRPVARKTTRKARPAPEVVTYKPAPATATVEVIRGTTRADTTL
ncbi:MAG: Flp pilus assembly protein CpaB [Burkholderiaceae bacterium]